MSRAPVILRLDGGNESRPGFAQRIAGEWLWSDVAVLPGARRATLPAVEAPASSESAWRIAYDGPGLVDGRTERLVSRVGPAGERRLEFADGEIYDVAEGGARIRRIAGRASSERALPRALGAPLAVALAARGTYLLHASAVAVRGGVVALTAASGSGKSTLASEAARRGLVRVADDQLPVRLETPCLAFPAFPQLKLTPPAGPSDSAPEALPLRALAEIGHSPALSAVSIGRLDPGAATLAFVRATVAARLFDETLLAPHLAACAHAAERVACYRFEYPSGADRLGEAVTELLELGACEV